MGRFSATECPKNMPPILKAHWPEIVEFQKLCHQLTLKVLTLFALALDVLFFLEVTKNSCLTTFSRNSIPLRMIH